MTNEYINLLAILLAALLNSSVEPFCKRLFARFDNFKDLIELHSTKMT